MRVSGGQYGPEEMRQEKRKGEYGAYCARTRRALFCRAVRNGQAGDREDSDRKASPSRRRRTGGDARAMIPTRSRTSRLVMYVVLHNIPLRCIAFVRNSRLLMYVALQSIPFHASVAPRGSRRCLSGAACPQCLTAPCRLPSGGDRKRARARMPQALPHPHSRIRSVG